MTASSTAACRICDNPTGNRIHVARELMFGTDEEFRYLECGACGTLNLLDVPADFSPYYPADYYSLEQVALRVDGRALQLYKRVRMATWLRTGVADKVVFRAGTPDWVAWLRQAGVTRTSAICDVGAGGGRLLAWLAREGFAHLTGIDPFLDADFDGGSYRLVKAELRDVSGPFELVMLHHSFEHLADPRAQLDELRRLVAPGGSLLIRVPLAQRWAWRRYGVNWVQLDPPRHVFLYSPSALVELVEGYGFSLDRCTYDSTPFQFWGSDQVQAGVPLQRSSPPEAVSNSPVLRERSRRLNEIGDGDQAAFLFRRRPLP